MTTQEWHWREERIYSQLRVALDAVIPGQHPEPDLKEQIERLYSEWNAVRMIIRTRGKSQ
jgi:hypothetical protein